MSAVRRIEQAEAPPLAWFAGSAEQRRTAQRYWIRDSIVGLLEMALYRTLRYLPTDTVSWIGAVIVKVTRHYYPASDRRARIAWARLRPESADRSSVDAALHRLWRCVSRTMTEFAVLDRLWAEGRVTVQGTENLADARAAGRPVLIAAVHLGNWEVIAVAGVSLGFKGAGIYLPPENRFEHRIVVEARSRIGAGIVPATPGSLRAALRTLRQKQVPFLVFVDDLVDDRVNAPALGRPLATGGNIAYVARLAMTTDAVVVPAYCLRVEDGARFVVTLMPPVDLARGRDKQKLLTENIARIDAAIAPVVRDHLDQWFYTLDIEFDGVPTEPAGGRPAGPATLGPPAVGRR